jgi:hypothetical protein
MTSPANGLLAVVGFGARIAMKTPCTEVLPDVGSSSGYRRDPMFRADAMAEVDFSTQPAGDHDQEKHRA